jgi:hypothetical protein
MGSGRDLRTKRSLAIAGLAGGLALAIGLSFGIISPAGAHTPHAGLDFTATALGQDDCDTSAGSTTCYIEPGSDFTLEVALELPSDIASYEAMDVVIEYSGVTSDDTANLQEFWTDCGFPAAFFEPGRIGVGCAIGLPPAEPSTYEGVLITNGFTCEESGSITLKHGVGNTILLETLGLEHAEAADEVLTIVCGDPPTATNTPEPGTATRAPSLGDVGDGPQSGTDSTTWIVIGGLLAIAAVSAGAYAWRLGRSSNEG